MTFDNSRRILATEAEEVQITRRVYRGGEGEYLINGQVCRLKDIKDLFLGSGAGTDAYCIIEQGRVDVLLQASTKDRRTIFEEAAGISRFKAKKIETLRKLERVDQNLQRLRDILDEVEKQLRSVKLQAAKAQRYQEYTARLQGAARRPGPAASITRSASVWRRRRESWSELRAALQRADGAGRGAGNASCTSWSKRLAGWMQPSASRRRSWPRPGSRSPRRRPRWRTNGAMADDLRQDLAQTRQRLAELTARLAGAGRGRRPRLPRSCSRPRRSCRRSEQAVAGAGAGSCRRRERGWRSCSSRSSATRTSPPRVACASRPGCRTTRSASRPRWTT